LITAVLVVAIVATVATTLALGEQVWFRQAMNMSARAQADSLRAGALNYAAILLTRDGKLNKTTDHLGELWAQPLPPLPVEDGMIAFTVHDAQGLFNLNNILTSDGKRSPADVAVFQQLLISQGIDPVLSGALLDWLDGNTTVDYPGGAEDIEYLSLPQPYRSANQQLQSVDELRLVKGFSAKDVEKLRPFVTAIRGPTRVNVNTAPDQVLAALTDLPVTALKTLLDSRVNKPVEEGKLLDYLPAGSKPPLANYGVNTSYFLVTIDIRYGRLQRRTEAMIERISGRPATVLWHRLPPLQFNMQDENKSVQN
jgi:general secretion pathway protein K